MQCWIHVRCIFAKDDPRTDPRLLAVLEAEGRHVDARPVPLTSANSRADILAFMDAVEKGLGASINNVKMLTPATEIETSTEVITGPDGNQITLYVTKPKGHGGTSMERLPCVLHTHGGAMAITTAAGARNVKYRALMAAEGLVVVGVEFRNSAGELGPHPFPAGLNDCYAALEWANAPAVQEKLGISKVVISGPSGGGNLCLATAMKAKQEGKSGLVQGVYALVPYIAGPDAYAARAPYASLIENDGYFLSASLLWALAAIYTADGDDAALADPLAWPSRATVEDLRGLPPHCISVNELDPLRDEGLEHAAKLASAGVEVYCRTVNGVTHSGDNIYSHALSAVAKATLRDIKGFADSC